MKLINLPPMPPYIVIDGRCNLDFADALEARLQLAKELLLQYDLACDRFYRAEEARAFIDKLDSEGL